MAGAETEIGADREAEAGSSGCGAAVDHNVVRGHH
jgi:hypothetical protein